LKRKKRQDGDGKAGERKRGGEKNARVATFSSQLGNLFLQGAKKKKKKKGKGRQGEAAALQASFCFLCISDK